MGTADGPAACVLLLLLLLLLLPASLPAGTASSAGLVATGTFSIFMSCKRDVADMFGLPWASFAAPPPLPTPPPLLALAALFLRWLLPLLLLPSCLMSMAEMESVEPAGRLARGPALL